MHKYAGEAYMDEFVRPAGELFTLYWGSPTPLLTCIDAAKYVLPTLAMGAMYSHAHSIMHNIHALCNACLLDTD